MHRDEQNDPTYLDCSHCLAHRSQIHRQSWACPYEPPLAEGRVTLPVLHEATGPLFRPDEGMDQCPGYYVNNPAVGETVVAHAWWDKGQLNSWCDGEPSALLIDAVTIFAGQCGEVEGYVMRRSKEGQG